MNRKPNIHNLIAFQIFYVTAFNFFFFWSREEPSQFDPLWPDLVQENDALHLKTELILLICAEDRFHTLLRS